jgi:RNA polymerase sigma factor (sigma-70 family)
VDRSGSHNLTREDLDGFLARLDPDRDRAEQKYHSLRRKLAKLFECRRAPCAEDLADEAIDRVVRKLSQVEIHDVSLYVFGVAQNVLREALRATVKNVPLDELPAGTLVMNPYEDEKRRSEQDELATRLECLDECMRVLPAAERTVVIGYYEKRKSENIRHRREMAEHLGMALGTLRVQAHRIRAKLAACVDRCLAKLD